MTRTPGPPTRRGMSLKARLFLAVGLPVAILVIALGLLSWRAARAAVVDALERELLAAVTLGASTLNPVSARFLLEGDEETRTYKRLVDKLQVIQKATGSVRVVLLGDDERVRADAAAQLPLLTPAPRVALDRAEIGRALAGTPAVSVPFEDEQGRRYLAAYARVPEPDAADDLGLDGGLDGGLDEGPAMLLAIEASAAVLDATDRVAQYLLGVCLLAIALVFLFAALVARTLTARLLRLADEASALAQGRLQEPLHVPAGDDEVTLLGRTLEDMRRALHDRDEERQMMLAGIAHEVRNPLGGMQLFLGLLDEAIAELPASPRAEERAELAAHVARVQKELGYLTGVVNDFLDFARDLPLVREPVDVRALLDDVVSLQAARGGPRLSVECAASGRFPMDRGRIKEALLNLIDNAQQASGPGGEVRVAASLREDGALVIEVADDGEGMPPDLVERAFAPFFTTREKGSGLGLPLVRKFARDHGGDARIASRPGEGTRVTLTLAP